MRRFSGTLVGVLALVLVGSCARDQRAGHAMPAGPQANAGTIAAAAAVTTEVYARPGVPAWQDGTLFSHTIGSAASADQSLGRGTDTVCVPTPALDGRATASMQWFISASSRTAITQPGTTIQLVAPDAANVPLTSLIDDGVSYVQVGASVIASKGGAVAATYPLPLLQPDASAGLLPSGYKGIPTGPSQGTVSAFVPTASGDMIAFTFTGQAAAATDLASGRSILLTGYSGTGAAARLASGAIVVLAWRAQEADQPIQVLTLDGTTLEVTGTADTGLSSDEFLQDTVLPGVGHDAVVAISYGYDTTRLDVWTLDANTLAAAPALPVGVGLSIAPAGTDQVYVYGGPARNTVGVLDLKTRTFTPDRPDLRTPDGTYIVGLV